MCIVVFMRKRCEHGKVWRTKTVAARLPHQRTRCEDGPWAGQTVYAAIAVYSIDDGPYVQRTSQSRSLSKVDKGTDS